MKEFILPNIKLKYYKTPKKQKGEKASGIKCWQCFEPNIVNIGGGFRDEKGNICNICEVCAVCNFRDEEGFRTLEAARARRRRIFDVGYLFGEIVIDDYMRLKGLQDFQELKKADDIFIKAGELYNYLFSKENKLQLEETASQQEIERQLKQGAGIIDLQEFFKDL